MIGVLSVALGGCAWTFSGDGPADWPEAAACEREAKWAKTDATLGGVFGVGALATGVAAATIAATDTCPAGELQCLGEGLGRGISIAVLSSVAVGGAVAAILHGVSAGHGYEQLDQCRKLHSPQTHWNGRDP